MKKMILPATVLLLSSLLVPALPAWSGHDMGAMGGMDMGSASKSIMLENAEQDGVMAMVHLNDVREAMAKNGMQETHHMMVMFTDAKTGKPIIEGTVAVKVTDPAGVTGEPKKMMLMGDGFGADISLAAPGKYSLEVGTKLADAKKRVFTFTYGK